ncbi:MAG: hypothetical protein Q9228_001336 [Teloschistes exilis]
MSGRHALAFTQCISRNRSLRAQRSRSCYHSYERDSSPPYPAAEDAILAAAITHVPEHGFTAAALTSGARDAGYPDVSANLFPTGPFSLVKYHLVTQRLALCRDSSTASNAENHQNVLDNVRVLTLRRLKASQPIIHRWQEGRSELTAWMDQALALQAMPKHLPDSLRELTLLSDEIHFLAGDTSVDTSWYTKRAALSAIYASTELFMTQDKSPNFKDTEEFLDRRWEGAQGVKTMVEEVGRWAGVQAMLPHDRRRLGAPTPSSSSTVSIPPPKNRTLDEAFIYNLDVLGMTSLLKSTGAGMLPTSPASDKGFNKA